MYARKGKIQSGVERGEAARFESFLFCYQRLVSWPWTLLQKQSGTGSGARGRPNAFGAQALIEQLDLLNPHPRPRGFVQKFRSYEDYEKWRSQQDNPRLW